MKIKKLRVASADLAGARAPYRLFGGFRLTLAALVLLQHGLLLLPEPARAIFHRLELGAVSVTVFFALSGYVVAEALDRFYAGRPARFLANRVLRIVPMYVAALLLTVVLESWFFSRGSLVLPDAIADGPPWRPGVILAGFLEIVPGVPARALSAQGFALIPFAWTLRIEFSFYLLAAAVWLLPPRLRSARAGACLAYALFGFFVWRHGALPQQMLCIPFFLFGICSYRLQNGFSAVAWANLVVVSLCVAVAFTYWGQRGHPVLAFQLPVLGLLYAALPILARWQPGSADLVALDKRLGSLSYPLYIGHGVILTVLRSATADRGWGLYAAGLLGSVVLAAGLDAVVDRRLRHTRERLRGVGI